MPKEREAALEWQRGVWDQISAIYAAEIDGRFRPVTDALLRRAQLGPSHVVLDVGVGTGAIVLRAASAVGSSGKVTGIDISPEMLAKAAQRMSSENIANVSLHQASAENIPAENNTFDVVLSSLTLMYVIDRSAAAKEIARVLKPGGRFVGAVWGASENCDIVRFQQTAGRFAGPPPVEGVGPGAMADCTPFLEALKEAGVRAHVESEILGFQFPSFRSAWDALAGVTTAHLPAEKRREAQHAVQAEMYPDATVPRDFLNQTQFIVGYA